MIVIITGINSWEDYSLFHEKLDALLSKVSQYRQITITNTARPGVETIGLLYAEEKGYQYNIVPCTPEDDPLVCADRVIETARSTNDLVVAIIFAGSDDAISNHYTTACEALGIVCKRISV